MNTSVRLDPAEVREIALPILRDGLGAYGLVDAQVAESVDQDGDPVLDISALYGPGAREPEPRASLKAELAIQQAVFRAGDERTIHLLHILPTDALSLPEP